MADLGRVGMIARWKPVHLGHVPVLEAVCGGATEALIGVGSSNRYNLRNPFKYEESAQMIRLVTGDVKNLSIVAVPDLDDGPRWREMVMKMLGRLDLFITDNPYVTKLLSGDYTVTRPVELVPAGARIPIEGSMVRREMARGEGWREMVPQQVEAFITEKGLDERFRREFGLETLAIETAIRRRSDVLVG